VRVLGLSAFYHDSAAALVRNGQIIAAAQEERFTRRKHDAGFPAHALRYCLAADGIELGDVDFVVFYEKPFLKFERLIETYLAFAPRGFPSFKAAMPLWIKEKLFQKRLLRKELQRLQPDFKAGDKLLFAEHHQSHAASAFYASPFSDAAILTLDGVGEWATTTAGHGHSQHLEITKEIHFPHSLGLLFSAFTYYTGFKVNSGEYKLMGLAPYGEPRFAQAILDNVIDVKDDGSFRLDMSFFDYCTGLRMTGGRFHELFGEPPKDPHEELTQREMDLAASVQAVINEIVLKLTRALASETRQKRLCMAGGVALNCVSNAEVLKDGRFEELWIQPAAGDAGGAVGAALAAYYDFAGRSRFVVPGSDSMKGAFLGPSFDQSEINHRLAAAGATFDVLRDDELIQRTVDAIEAGKAVGWFQGRMEFGPRALGARSILGDPRSPTMQSLLNLKVKFRESFRPFAPAVLRERVSEWFELDVESPYMLLIADVAEPRRRAVDDADALFGLQKLKLPRSDIPAVTHVDYSARVQTVHQDTNPLFHSLIAEFAARTGCPVLVNTSFNVRGEPIVCTPENAFECFMGTDIDVLVVGRCILEKSAQSAEHRPDHRHQFVPD
jgi:carbamoyltransferase